MTVIVTEMPPFTTRSLPEVRHTKRDRCATAEYGQNAEGELQLVDNDGKSNDHYRPPKSCLKILLSLPRRLIPDEPWSHIGMKELRDRSLEFGQFAAFHGSLSINWLAAKPQP
jgi:hypothetical protein